MANTDFIVPLNGLAASGEQFFWRAGKEFFESFDNSEITDADLEINCTAAKSSRKVVVDCSVDGNVTVPCDRCLEDLQMPVGLDVALLVKFGEGEDVEEDGREVVYVDDTDTELDLSQIIYDYVCLSLPIQRTHPEGQCNPDTVKYMFDGEDSEMSEETEEVHNPFAALKGLF